MHSHPLGRSEATPTPCPTTTPFNAFRPVPGGALYTVFTATLGLIKGLSVSRLGCEPRTPRPQQRACPARAKLGSEGPPAPWCTVRVPTVGPRSLPPPPPNVAVQPAACRHLPAWGTLCSPGKRLPWGLQGGAAPPGLQEHRGPCLPMCSRRWLLCHPSCGGGN